MQQTQRLETQQKAAACQNSRAGLLSAESWQSSGHGLILLVLIVELAQMKDLCHLMLSMDGGRMKLFGGKAAKSCASGTRKRALSIYRNWCQLVDVAPAVDTAADATWSQAPAHCLGLIWHL